MTGAATRRLARAFVVLATCLGWAWPAGAAVGPAQPPHAVGKTSSAVRYAYFTTSQFFPPELRTISDFPAAFRTFDPGKDVGVVFVGAVEGPRSGQDFKVRGVLRREDGTEVTAFADEVKVDTRASWYPIRRVFAMERLRGSVARTWTLELLVDDRPVGTFRFEVAADPLWARRPKPEPAVAQAPSPPSTAEPPAPAPPRPTTPPAVAQAPPSTSPPPLAPPAPPSPPAAQPSAPPPPPAPQAAPPQIAKAPTPALPAPIPPRPQPQPTVPPAPAPIVDADAPKVAINYPPADTKIEADNILLLALVTDNSDVATVEVSVNGVRAASEKTGAGRAVPVRARIALQPGENILEVTAIDKAGNASQTVRSVVRTAPTTVVKQPVKPKEGKRWAVVIGVGTYENAGIPKLKYAEKDARAIYDFLIAKGGFKKDDVQLLTDTSAIKPTLLNIKRALGEWLARRAATDDTVLVYYAGHGAPEVDVSGVEADGLSKYLVPRDADPESLFTTGFPMDDIHRVFVRLQAERVVFMIDTCFSGATGGRTFMKQVTRSGHLSQQFLERVTKSRGRVIISAAGPNELALELPNLGHGVFTYYLLKGLEGEADRDKDGIVTLSELYEYLEDRVSRHAQREGGKQRPIMKGEVEGQLPLVEIRKN